VNVAAYPACPSNGSCQLPVGVKLPGLLFVGLALSALGAGETSSATRTIFRPGELWLDHHGAAINAHGGGILFHANTYYWFGEHKIEGGAGNRAQVGVHVYTSTNLYDWTDAGIALAVSEDPASEITRGCILERPKVIFNARTKKFVMWFHLEPKDRGYTGARSGVAVADQPTGPFQFLGSMRPNAGVWPQNVPEEFKRPLNAAESAALKRPAAVLSQKQNLPPRLRQRTDGARHDAVRR
jgi:hypothetical protein